jgi:hypothetical protein
VRDADGESCELAIVVADGLQRQGLGVALLVRLIGVNSGSLIWQHRQIT